MRGDFSRLPFDPARHYDAVLQQQGRVTLDADWNEQVAIQRHRREGTARDAIGAHGVPVDDAGFAITARAALAFDGVDDHVAIVERGGLAAAELSAFTVEAWINPRASGSGGTIVSSVRDFAAGEWLLGVEADGRLSFKQVTAQPPDVDDGDDGLTRVAMSNLLSDVVLPFDAYSHVALTADRERVSLFLDGELVGEVGQPGPRGEAARPRSVGALVRRGVSARHFAGQVEDLRVWTLARSEDKIARDRRRALPGDEPGLLLYWTCEAGADGLVNDATGSGNAGELGGGDPDRRPAWLLRDLGIGRGRLYLDGLLVENEQKCWLSSQPDLPDAALPERAVEAERYLVYLDVWKRHLTHLEDPSLREVALGGPDTTTREQVVWQVRTLPLPADGTPGGDDGLLLDWYGWAARRERSGRLRARRDPLAAPGLGNQLYRVELHDGEEMDGPAVAVEPLAAEGQVRVAAWTVGGRPWRVGDAVQLFDDDPGGSSERIATEVVAADDVGHALLLAAAPRELRRFTAPRLRRLPTVKWSRENGSIAFGVAHLDAAGGVATLHDLGRDDHALGEGDWVELTDDAATLQGRACSLCRVAAIDRTRRTVTLGGVPADGTGGDPSRHPLLRRWDQPGVDGEPTLASGLIAAPPGEWLTLEDGVQVRLEGDGPYRSGDYWLIPARALVDDVEWPRDGRGPAARPPHGVRHRHAPLALVSLEGERATIADCRQPFETLTELTGHLREYMRRSGGQIEGPLGVGGTLTIGGDVLVAGQVDARLRPGAVDSDQIADGAVTSAKLAPDIGAIPPGFAILGDAIEPPPGFVNTGSSITTGHPGWRRALPLDRAGGIAAAALDGVLYVLAETGQLWSYDPRADAVREHRRLEPRRQGFAVAALGGRLYVVGGFDEYGAPSALVSEYDPRVDSWRMRSPLPTARGNLAAAAHEDVLFAIGGDGAARLGSTSCAAVEAFDPRADAWRARTPMPTSRSHLAAAVASGFVYALGGERRAALLGRSVATVGRVEQYDPTADRWLRRASLRVPRRGLAAAEHEGRVVLMGGSRAAGGPGTRVHEVFDPASDEWFDAAPLPSPRTGWALVAVGGALYGVGPVHSSHHRPEAAIELVSQTFYVHRKVAAPAGSFTPSSEAGLAPAPAQPLRL